MDKRGVKLFDINATDLGRLMTDSAEARNGKGVYSLNVARINLQSEIFESLICSKTSGHTAA